MKVVQPKGFALLHKGEWLFNKRNRSFKKIPKRGIYFVHENDFVLPVPVVSALGKGKTPRGFANTVPLSSKTKRRLTHDAVVNSRNI